MPTTDDFPLFGEYELTQWLGYEVSAERASWVEQVVWGWLKPVLGLDSRPDPVPPEVFSWAIELGAIGHENPSGLSSEQLGPALRNFSSERRAEILQLAADGGSTKASLTPVGSFPPATCYPDPAQTLIYRYW